MHLDASRVGSGAVLHYDVCIVGAGPAGLAVAHGLAAPGRRLCLLESGGFERDGATQRLARGRNLGRPYFRLDNARVRMVGGSSNRWLTAGGPWSVDGGMRSRPLDAIDFEARDGVLLRAWPLGRTDLWPFYARAHELCRLGPLEYEAANWIDAASAPPLVLPGGRVGTTVCQFAPSGMFRELGRALGAGDGVTLVTGGTVVDIETEDGGRAVSGVRVATLDGNRFTVRARHFVLALGGIENARLLLASNASNPAGLGNRYDHVGRYFMEHIQVESGLFRPSAGLKLSALSFYGRHAVRGTPVLGALRVNDDVQRREGLLNTIATFRPRPGVFAKPAVRSAAELWWSARQRSRPPEIRHHLHNIARAPHDVIRATLARAALGGTVAPDVATLVLTAEQAPNPASRITLARERDALGLRRAQLDWQFTPLDAASFRRTQDILDEEFRAGGLGSVEAKLGETRPDPRFVGCWHHMGTTRMSSDERLGVVDADCRVHGVSNLFVAGSSVFPTVGATTVTLTIVALSLRLADHLASLLSAAPVRL